MRTFALWSIPVGAFLAMGLYLVTAFSVPLLYERRTEVIPAIVGSVRAVLGNLGPALAWALIIVVGLAPGILIPPLLPVTLPVLAYGSFALYRTVFPLGSEPTPSAGPEREGGLAAGRASERQRRSNPSEGSGSG